MMQDEDVVICRCEEVTKAEILDAIRRGHHTVDSVKKAVRAGMGACQGRSCARLILGMLLEAGVQTPETAAYAKGRFPLVPLAIGEMGEAGE